MKSTEEDRWRRSRTFTPNFLDKFGKRVAFWRLWAEMWPLKAIEGRRATAPWTTTSTATEKLCVTWVYYERRPFFINDIQCRKVIRQIVHWEIVFPLNIIVYSIRKTKGLESLCSFPFQWLNMFFASKVPKVSFLFSQTSKFGFCKTQVSKSWIHLWDFLFVKDWKRPQKRPPKMMPMGVAADWWWWRLRHFWFRRPLEILDASLLRRFTFDFEKILKVKISFHTFILY